MTFSPLKDLTHDQIQEYEVTISLQIQNKTLNKIVQATAVHADTRLYSNDLT